MAKKELPPENPAPANPFADDATFVEPTHLAIAPDLQASAESSGDHAIATGYEHGAEPPVFHFGAESHVEPMKSAEHWHTELETQAWELAAAKMNEQWPEGRELTRKQYTAAVEKASGLVSR